MPKIRPKINAYAVISESVDSGIAYGLNRADKHASDPLTEAQRERVRYHVEQEVMNALCEVVDFD